MLLFLIIILTGGADSRTNVYLVQTEDMGQTWQTVDGVTLTTPLTSPQSAALVYDYQKENKLVYLNDLNFDKDGNPYYSGSYK